MNVPILIDNIKSISSDKLVFKNHENLEICGGVSNKSNLSIKDKLKVAEHNRFCLVCKTHTDSTFKNFKMIKTPKEYLFLITVCKKCSKDKSYKMSNKDLDDIIKGGYKIVYETKEAKETKESHSKPHKK